MNTLIDQTNELVQQAYEYAARRFVIDKKSEAELLFRLNLIEEPSAIPFLFPLVFSDNKKLAETIAGIIHKIVIQIPVDALESLDEMMRRVAYYYNQSWSEITVNQVKSLNFEKSIGNTISALLCSHRNGYVREQAIKGLLPEFSELNIPVLLIRANDWVDEIKTLVSAKLIELIDDNKISSFIPSLNLIAKLYQKARHDHSVLLNVIESQLNKNCYDKLLLIVASCSNKKISRAAFKIAAKDVSRMSQLIQASSQSRDIIIKLERLNVGSQYLSDAMLFELLGTCMEDKSASIRKKCVNIYLDKFPKLINQILINTLFDKSFSLRELARFYLRGSDNNVVKIYRDALINKNKPSHIAIMGLAEVGSGDDFELIENHMRAPALNVRAACIYAIFKLKLDNKQELILKQLPSSEPRILKVISEGLIKNPDDFNIDLIEKFFCQYGNSYSNMLFIKIKIATIDDRWSCINYMLDQVQRIESDKIKLFLEHEISRWIIANSPNTVFTKPKIDRLISIMEKVDQLILQDNNVDLYNALKRNISCFIE
jgi:hypothetical protein